MKATPLIAARRAETGKGAARKMRTTGRIPAVLYGRSTETRSLTLSRRDITTALRLASSEHILIDLATEGNGGNDLALVRDVQHDPVTMDIVHVDLLRISPDEPIKVQVGVHLEGVPEGVKNFGGIMQQVRRELMVEALPADVPDSITVDVTALNIGDTIHVGEITIDAGKILDDPVRTVVSVVPPTVIKEVEEEEAAAEAEGEEAVEGEGEAEGEAAKAEGAGDEKKKDEKKKDEK